MSGTVLALLGIFLGSGVLGTVVGKLMPQRTSKPDRMDKLEEDMGDLKATVNTQADYIQVLRLHIVDGKPPPPPPFPEGMRL